MQNIEQQIQELDETQEDFVLVLNTEGFVAHSSQNWRVYCQSRQLPTALWKDGGNYFKCLEEMKKFNVVQSMKDILMGNEKEVIQLSLFYDPKTIEYLSVKYQSFSLDNNSKGIILYKQQVTNVSSLSCLKAEVVLENMAEAFFLLDNQMRFHFLNSESEKILQRKKQELIGRSIWSCFPKAVGTKFYSTYIRAMQDRVPLQFEEYYAPLDTRFSVKVTPVSDGGLAVYYQKVHKEETLEAKLLKVPSTDYLTGWLTRVKFEESIEQILQKELPFSLIYINLDNFKHINTLYNHKTGDQVIKKIVEKVENLLSPQDLAGRLDGDELILLHLHQPKEEIEEFPQKIRNIFPNSMVLENAKSITVNASIGVSSYPQDSYGAEELIAYAETAMRKAKEQNGSSYSHFHSGMGIDLARRFLIEESLAGNLQEIGYHFVLQPQINCATGDLTGVEVLSRWNHPTLGPISPIEFIGIAEETGTISRLTNHLLEEVFTFINEEKKHSNSFPKTAINVTSSLLTSQTFFHDLFLMMEKNQIPADQIELEITESVELTGSELTLTNLMTCRSKGISIALDDFGTGFSMLAYLVDYPIDKIKLDKSFISKIGQDARSEAVLKSLIQFVKGIDCQLLAEGVETPAEALFLQENGCPIHQGYLHDKPLSPEAFSKKYLNIS
ncbi:GGDEF domain-containing phosphodiesterase [Planococcus sp. S3-L1]|nr:GGDEF domain-containing phosphodiesterase [Planococcus sp. S3-L1]MDJ0332273.1 EAL domain-containing protein [Planococcus sp. S3-L1]